VGSGELGVGNLLSAQYAHARCCSLIKMCLREGLIKLNKVNLSVNSEYQEDMRIIPSGNEILPSPLPWLGLDNKLRFYKKSERVLLSELIQIVDDIVCPFTNSSVNWEKVTLNLSQAFDNFWCNCRIVRNSDIELARARFGLVLAVRSVLQFLLEKKLGVFAPFEL
jgi:DALR anticodon binding domain